MATNSEIRYDNCDGYLQPLGMCPKCNADVFTRERRPFGNDICTKGHVFPSKDTIIKRGIGQIIGKWPGDETDDEIDQALKELG